MSWVIRDSFDTWMQMILIKGHPQKIIYLSQQKRTSSLGFLPESRTERPIIETNFDRQPDKDPWWMKQIPILNGNTQKNDFWAKKKSAVTLFSAELKTLWLETILFVYANCLCPDMVCIRPNTYRLIGRFMPKQFNRVSMQPSKTRKIG